ncbi:IucA/IucC family C-terminal-domain containing protein [Bacillus sp. FJAT-47783]|uniref:IucA/IucC family C-terminal-domain containing protein n=1 Tax=Bacillus sp. FJAT-47783 TaxID=2922712 RepID=UPI001FAD798D|nr:IucA/IucC family C-terminal-domain containing protein [Bacillus sp. FJAT-47783]
MASLTKEQIDQLKEYRLTIEAVDSELSIDCKDLLNRESLTIYLDRLRQEFQTSKRAVCGSMLLKRYGFLAVLALYSMSIWNKMINVQLENVSIQSGYKNDVWLPNFMFKSLQVIDMEHERHKKRDELLTVLFRHHFDPVIKSVSQYAKISPIVLWENVSIYIFWMYESLRNKGLPVEMSVRVQEDFDYVINGAKGELFGSFEQNPLTPFYCPKVYESTVKKEIRIRKTCCLYYLTNGGTIRCQSCPCQSKHVSEKE